MSFRGSWALKLVLWILLAMVILFLFVLPVLTTWLLNRSPESASLIENYLPIVELVQGYLLQGLTAAWVFFLGACFASFLNVVAWRIPRGRSILGSSACPHCETRLSFRDNVPVIGWIRNGGRCRTCKTPITPRYVLVEILLGSIFLLLVLLQLVSGGINLPLRDPTEVTNAFAGVLMEPEWDLIQITGLHLTLVCSLFTFALVELDKRTVPFNIFFAFALVGIGTSVIWPAAQLVGWTGPVDSIAGISATSPHLYLTLLIGLVTGAFVGLITWMLNDIAGMLTPKKIEGSSIEKLPDHAIDDQDATAQVAENPEHRSSLWNLVFSISICGLFLGCQSAVSIVLLFLVVRTCIRVVATDNIPAVNDSAAVGLALLVHLGSWRVSARLPWWPGPGTPASTLLMVVAISGVAVFAMWMHSKSANRKNIQP